jgi:hypothetical protein
MVLRLCAGPQTHALVEVAMAPQLTEDGPELVSTIDRDEVDLGLEAVQWAQRLADE